MSTIDGFLRRVQALGDAAGRRAVQRRRRRIDRLLTELDVFDARTFGYRYRFGGMGRMGQLRPDWLSRVVEAARAERKAYVLVPTDLARHAANRIDTDDD